MESTDTQVISSGNATGNSTTNTSAQSSSKDQHFDFLSLPAELRNNIYELLVPTVIQNATTRADASLRKTTSQKVTGLYLANKQISQEFLSVIYDKSTYCLGFTARQAVRCRRGPSLRKLVSKNSRSSEDMLDEFLHVHDGHAELPPCHRLAMNQFRLIHIVWTGTFGSKAHDRGLGGLREIAQVLGPILRVKM